VKFSWARGGETHQELKFAALFVRRVEAAIA
jgi:hypothetical protein